MSRVKYERASEWQYRVYLIYSVGDVIHTTIYHLYLSPSAEAAVPSIRFFLLLVFLAETSTQFRWSRFVRAFVKCNRNEFKSYMWTTIFTLLHGQIVAVAFDMPSCSCTHIRIYTVVVDSHASVDILYRERFAPEQFILSPLVRAFIRTLSLSLGINGFSSWAVFLVNYMAPEMRTKTIFQRSVLVVLGARQTFWRLKKNR